MVGQVVKGRRGRPVKLRRDEELFGFTGERKPLGGRFDMGVCDEEIKVVNQTVNRRLEELRRDYDGGDYSGDMLRRTILLAGELTGYEHGEYGLLSYLTEVSKKYPKLYCSLLGKVLDGLSREEVGKIGKCIDISPVSVEIVGLSEVVSESTDNEGSGGDGETFGETEE